MSVIVPCSPDRRSSRVGLTLNASPSTARHTASELFGSDDVFRTSKLRDALAPGITGPNSSGASAPSTSVPGLRPAGSAQASNVTLAVALSWPSSTVSRTVRDASASA